MQASMCLYWRKEDNYVLSCPTSSGFSGYYYGPKTEIQSACFRKSDDRPLATMIQGDHLIFYVNVHPATIYVIKSKKVAEGYKQFFMMLWNMAK